MVSLREASSLFNLSLASAVDRKISDAGTHHPYLTNDTPCIVTSIDRMAERVDERKGLDGAFAHSRSSQIVRHA